MTRADAGLRIGVAELRRRPGNRMHVEREVPMGDVGISTAATPPGAEALVDAVLESQSTGVTVAGTVTVPWVGPCRRCLEPTGGELVAEFGEVFSDRPDGADLLAFDGDAVDLTQSVRDAVVLGLPLAPLCREDCPGPEPEAFPVAREGDGTERPVDPRWAALDQLRFDPGTEDG